LIHFYIHSDSKISKKKIEEISGRRGLRMGLLWASLSWGTSRMNTPEKNYE